MSAGTLYIVATPIGNMGDISFRALEVLRTCELILCEDTRVTRGLLAHYRVITPTRSYHEHTSDKLVREIVAELAAGRQIALVSDAGTPGISDPGSRLVAAVRRVNERGEAPAIQVIPVPGASALVAALSVSGFPADKFLFLGFPPHKKGRQKLWKEVAQSEHTVVFYESCHRIKTSLGELAETLRAARQICVCRELTKKFETVYRCQSQDWGSLNILEKGEFVVVVGPG